jgi:tRNA dimethylallyltransferase
VSRPVGVLAILGATATGKTALAVELAERLGGEVISADAFAVYRGIDAGTAKPTAGERARVPHHLLDARNPRDPWSAGDFAREARRIAGELLAGGKLPILCGGTGFYARTFFEGLFAGPAKEPEVREALEAVRRRRGGAFLAKMISVLDPASGRRVARADAARALRLLEIAFAAGRPPSALFRERPGERWERPALKVLLTLPRPVLYGRIEERFHRSISPRLPDEVRGLLASGLPDTAPAFAAIGYRETAEYVRGLIGEAEWRERILRQTRRFAKRQVTWFRREPGVVPFRADQAGLVDVVAAEARRLLFGSEGGPG